MLEKQIKNGFCLLGLNRKPVNSLNTEFWSLLMDTLVECEQNPAVRGIIIYSNLDRSVFSAGNDLNELYAPNSSKEQYTKFWTIQNKFLAKLLISPLITIACIKGACPAAGCAIAMCCDFRFCTLDTSMGLNEVAIGVSVPIFWVKRLSQVIGISPAEKLCYFALMPKAEELVKLGLVDKAFETQNDTLAEAQKLMAKLLKLEDVGRQLTKSQFHQQFSNEWSDEKRLKLESDLGWSFLSDQKTIDKMVSVLMKLSKSKL